jgi:LmbE family N-acetylglucosaminyl deacetylase
MNKIIFGIFAHPDDEAFGPSGTLLMETQAGTQLHLITLTSGDAGMNPDNHDNLSDVRLDEWRAAGTLMGASSMHYLGYKDGQLNNHTMIEASKRIIDIIADVLQHAAESVEVELMTNDTNGISGHIDHIVAARAACHVFYSFKRNDPRFTRIRLACIPRIVLPEVNIDWLYMEPGRTADEIGETIDARELRETIITIMRAHHTQRSDGERHIKQRGDTIGINSFIVKT